MAGSDADATTTERGVWQPTFSTDTAARLEIHRENCTHSTNTNTPSCFYPAAQYQTTARTRCRVSHNAKQAIMLNSASSKFRNDIIEVKIATYRLQG